MELSEDKAIVDSYVLELFELFDGEDGIDRSELSWQTRNGIVQFYVNCSDCFFWGCADAEDITKENFPILKQACEDLKSVKFDPDEKYPTYWHAGLLFASRVRQMRPQGAMYKYIPKRFWKFFDECGPVRDAQFGNPCPRPADDYPQLCLEFGDSTTCTLSEMVKSKLDSDEHKRTTYNKGHITHNEDAIIRVLNNGQLTTNEMFQILQWIGIDLKNITA